MKMLSYFSIFLLTILATSSLSAAEAKLMRYPNTSTSEITFSYGGNIYTAPIVGGLARKITSSQGTELFPRFSPDGKTIAFTGEYDGNIEIYTIPSEGGTPKRLTYAMDMPDISERQGPAKIIMQWTNGGKEILYRSRQESWNVLTGKLYTVGLNAALPKEVPVNRGGFASFSPDGSKMAYNKIFREYRTWKRYSGGQADDIWIYDFTTKSLENISNNPAQDIIPMWAGDKIYYLSDRDHTMNLFCYDLVSKTTKKVTNFSEFDVKFPSLGANHISFDNGGDIYTLKFDNDYLQKVDIIIGDDNPDNRPTFKDVKKYITSNEISPDGKNALFCARGDIFIVPKKNGNTRNITNSNDVHDRNATWSPDGKWIAYISDESGKDEIFVIKPDGSGKSQITNDAQSYRWELLWSPDSKKLLNSDKMMRLFWVDVASKKTTEIVKSNSWEIRDFKWSPDSRWVAYTDNLNNSTPVVFLHSTETGKTFQVSSEFFESNQAEFSVDSKYLFFVSQRTFNPTIGEFEYNFTYNNMAKIFGVTLKKDLMNPMIKQELPNFGTKDEEAADSEESATKGKATKKKGSAKEDKFDLASMFDTDGIMDRIFEFPIPSANYWGLTAAKDKIYYIRTQPGNPPTLYSFDLESLEEEKVGNFFSYSLSKDAKEILVKNGADYFIEKTKSNLSPKDGKLDLSDLSIFIDPKLEWKQIYNETWRQMKDFFYDENMHGVDWNKMQARYASLLPYLNSRADLTYILGELIGELNTGHSYVGGGDLTTVDAVKIGYLGADYEFDAKTGFYKIKNILNGRNWEEKTRSPLTEPGINIKAGDYLLAIDGVDLSLENTPSKALLNKSEKFVALKYNSNPVAAGAKEALVKTIENESDLRYFNWVERNRKFVDSATNGRIGYVHIPDMMPNNGLNEFVKYFYPQVRKEGLIIDDRYNGGGNVSPIVIERLRRILAVAKNARNQEMVYSTPNAVMTGPLVMIINEQSMSDGDLFPYQFKLMGLGKIIGKRTWGGVIGIRGSLPFIDGGYLNRPEFANFGRDTTWILEGVGMKPDLEVDNHPGKEYEGIDEQLIKAIELVLEDVKTDQKPKLPNVPVKPIKK